MQGVGDVFPLGRAIQAPFGLGSPGRPFGEEESLRRGSASGELGECGSGTKFVPAAGRPRRSPGLYTIDQLESLSLNRGVIRMWTSGVPDGFDELVTVEHSRE